MYLFKSKLGEPDRRPRLYPPDGRDPQPGQGEGRGHLQDAAGHGEGKRKLFSSKIVCFAPLKE